MTCVISINVKQNENYIRKILNEYDVYKSLYTSLTAELDAYKPDEHKDDLVFHTNIIVLRTLSVFKEEGTAYEFYDMYIVSIFKSMIKELLSTMNHYLSYYNKIIETIQNLDVDGNFRKIVVDKLKDTVIDNVENIISVLEDTDNNAKYYYNYAETVKDFIKTVSANRYIPNDSNIEIYKMVIDYMKELQKYLNKKVNECSIFV